LWDNAKNFRASIGRFQGLIRMRKHPRLREINEAA
jgi:hypothetical protein